MMSRLPITRDANVAQDLNLYELHTANHGAMPGFTGPEPVLNDILGVRSAA